MLKAWYHGMKRVRKMNTYCKSAIINRADTIAEHSSGSFFDTNDIWRKAPVLTGSTKFEPLPDVKNIMITGGAGFM